MKKKLTALFLAAALTLSGCGGGGVYRNYRRIERLRLIQTVGLDVRDDRALLSLSSGPGLSGEPPLLLQQDGRGIEDAMARAQDYAPEDDLYYAHVQYFLLGEEAAGFGVGPWLDWFERSPDMRMDTAFFVVTGTQARTLVLGGSDKTTDVTGRLDSLTQELESRGFGPARSVRDAASALAEHGGALCFAVTAGDDPAVVPLVETRAVLPAGMVILKDGVPAGSLSQEDALAAVILAGYGSGGLLELPDFTAELLETEKTATPLFGPDGSLTGLELRISVKAALLEQQRPGLPAAEQDAALSRELTERLCRVLALEQSLCCDFLGLRALTEQAAPYKSAVCGAVWPDVLKTLTVTAAADGRLLRGYDLRGGEAAA